MSLYEESDIVLEDVYFIAQNIAEEFEKITHCCDIQIFRSVVEKVIRALEILESIVKRNQALKLELSDTLTSEIRLASMKESCFHERALLKESFEEAEEEWEQEASKLRAEISMLKNENENLKHWVLIEKQNEQVQERLKAIIKDLELAMYKLRCSLDKKDRALHNLTDSANSLLAENHESWLTKNVVAEDRHGLPVAECDSIEKSNIDEKEKALLLENATESFPWLSKHQEGGGNASFCTELLKKEIRRHIRIELKLLEKVKTLQSQLDAERCCSEKYVEKMGLEPENKHFLERTNKISQLFHFFLGIFSIIQPG